MPIQFSLCYFKSPHLEWYDPSRSATSFLLSARLGGTNQQSLPANWGFLLRHFWRLLWIPSFFYLTVPGEISFQRQWWHLWRCKWGLGWWSFLMLLSLLLLVRELRSRSKVMVTTYFQYKRYLQSRKDLPMFEVRRSMNGTCSCISTLSIFPRFLH